MTIALSRMSIRTDHAAVQSVMNRMTEAIAAVEAADCGCGGGSCGSAGCGCGSGGTCGCGCEGVGGAGDSSGGGGGGVEGTGSGGG